MRSRALPTFFRLVCPGMMNVRAMYRFLMNPSRYGSPRHRAVSKAHGRLVSGTGITTCTAQSTPASGATTDRSTKPPARAVFIAQEMDGADFVVNIEPGLRTEPSALPAGQCSHLHECVRVRCGGVLLNGTHVDWHVSYYPPDLDCQLFAHS